MKAIQALLTIATILSGAANASIIAHDGFFTDTSSGLDWLNNQPLAGQSYSSVLGGYGGYTTSGWRYATSAELLYLVESNVGSISDLNSSNNRSSSDYSAGAYDSAYSLINLLGMTASVGSPPDPGAVHRVNTDEQLTFVVAQGWYDDGGVDSKIGIFDLSAFSNYYGDLNPFARTQILPDFVSPDYYAGTNVSAILVRASVPAPAAAWLFGCLALA